MQPARHSRERRLPTRARNQRTREWVHAPSLHLARGQAPNLSDKSDGQHIAVSYCHLREQNKHTQNYLVRSGGVIALALFLSVPPPPLSVSPSLYIYLSLSVCLSVLSLLSLCLSLSFST